MREAYYVEALVAPHTVNTVPPETLEAYRDHGAPAVRIDQAIRGCSGAACRAGTEGRQLEAVTRELEKEGSLQFAASHASVLSGIEAKAGTLAAR